MFQYRYKVKADSLVIQWTDNISDRFKNTLDEHLATDVPGWAERVNQRQKAEFRPLDGFAAPALQGWLQGAG